MTVGELRGVLALLDDACVVIVSGDADKPITYGREAEVVWRGRGTEEQFVSRSRRDPTLVAMSQGIYRCCQAGVPLAGLDETDVVVIGARPGAAAEWSEVGG